MRAGIVGLAAACQRFVPDAFGCIAIGLIHHCTATVGVTADTFGCGLFAGIGLTGFFFYIPLAFAILKQCEHAASVRIAAGENWRLRARVGITDLFIFIPITGHAILLHLQYALTCFVTAGSNRRGRVAGGRITTIRLGDPFMPRSIAIELSREVAEIFITAGRVRWLRARIGIACRIQSHPVTTAGVAVGDSGN